MGIARKRLQEELEESFGDRYKIRPEREEDALIGVVSPVDIEEVQLLAELAERYSRRLAPEGADTAPKMRRPPSEISVRFDLMREASVPQPPDYLWSRCSRGYPGCSWRITYRTT